MKKGDFIRMDFVGKIASTGEVFDFTLEKVAKEKGLHNPKHTYAPVLVIIGDKMVIPGVEKQLTGMKVGDEKKFKVPKEEAFGERNPKLIRVISLSAFIKQKVNPNPGSFVDIDGMRGKVHSVSGGRVRVDFNHPLAGKELDYWVKITEKIEKPTDKIGALFSNYRVPFKKKLEAGKLTIESDKEVPHEMRKFIEEIINKWVKEVKSVDFVKK